VLKVEVPPPAARQHGCRPWQRFVFSLKLAYRLVPTMARVDIQYHQAGRLPGAYTDIGEGEIKLPPCLDRVLIRCGIVEFVVGSWVLPDIGTDGSQMAGASAFTRPVNRKDRSSTLGVQKGETQKVGSNAPVSLTC